MTSEAVIGDPLLNSPTASPEGTEHTHFADIDLATHKGVNYALAHNGLPFLRSLRIRPLTTGFGPIEVKISGRWAAGPTPPIKPFSKVVDIISESGDWINVDVRDCRLDDVALAELSEDSPAEVILELFDRQTGAWQVHRQDVLVYSRTQWLALQPEITAAFVQPNHPSVAQILTEAAHLLRQATGSDGVDGYQGLARGEDARPVAIARAIFDALSHHITHYINPPASFNDRIGQRLRPLDQILTDKHGTCLDLACAYASVLEQAGLHPIVFLVHGHAFTGIWTRPTMMAQAATESFAAIINRYETGDIVPIETTLIPGGEGNFDAAVQSASKHFTERDVDCDECQTLAATSQPTSVRPHMETAIDIKACRKDRILPLPARVVQGDTVIVVIDRGADQVPVVERRNKTTGELLPNTVPARVQQWKNALLDLSFRNRLLKFSPSASGLGLLTGPGLVGQVEDLVNDGKPISVVSMDSMSEVRQQAFAQVLEAAFGVRNVAEAVRRHGSRTVQQALASHLTGIWNEQQAVFAFTDRGTVPTRAKNLMRDARVEEQDSGVNNLHLTFGTLKWSAPGSNVGEVTSPIFLVPVKMVLKRGALVPELRLDEDSSTTLNYCLIEALRARAHLELDWFKRDIRDGAGLDVEAGLRELRDEITDRGLDVRSDFEVVDSLAIGLLRFNKIRLWKDLDEHWERFTGSPVVHHFLHRVGEPFTDPVEADSTTTLDDTVLLNPQPADGAQSVAIQRAIGGQTFVLEGPPGTGKSQTITNLLANALARGLKVLFVAEKQAALDVVNERLEAVGLMPFCLDLHDKGSTTKQIREQLLEALDYKPDNKGAQWDREAIAFAALVERLDRYRGDLHQRQIGGLSYYDAYRRLLELGDGDVMPIGREITGVSDATVDELRHRFAGLDTFTDAAQPHPGHPWAMATIRDFSSIDRPALVAELNLVLQHHRHLASSQSSLATLAAATGTLADLDVAISVASLASAGVEVSPSLLQQAARGAWRSDLERMVGTAIAARDALTSAVGTITAQHWGADRAAISSAVTAASSSFAIGRNKRIDQALGIFTAAPALANRTAKTVVAELSSVLSLLEQAVTSVAQLEAATAGLRILDGEPFGPGVLEAAGHRIATVSVVADRSVVGDRFSQALVAAVSSPMLFPEADFEAVRELRGGLAAVGSRLGATEESWLMWRDDDPLMAAVRRCEEVWTAGAADQSLITLNRWVALVDAVAALDVPGLGDARRGILDGSVPGRGAATAFERGLADVVLTVAGEQAQFDIFDHHDQNRRVAQFIAAVSARQDLLRSVIPHMLHSRRTFDSDSQSGRIGKFRTDLRSTARSRGSQSIREMIQRYPDLITELTPCFLMSPDSVAKFIPPGSIQFDLVVFDEASQIPVADAIGALGRAKSAVIVGDSKQMPPTSIAQATVGSGEDEVVPVAPEPDIEVGEYEPTPDDAESILEECVASGVPQEMLSWHYRSRDEVLITFSNQHYYDGRLASFPAPSLLQPGCGIEYHRVEGRFDHGRSRTNPIEADAIVADVVRRVHDPFLSRFSIGVVTLNMEQRKLITQKLLDTEDPLVLDLLETDDKERELFVLNLESVQGRERDVVILGTAFSKKADGSAMPLNFGPLTNPRGERRLNVAVTRARRQMVIYSSFDPTDLARATSTGMVHLRTYLTLAKQASEDPESLERAATSNVEDPYLDEIAEAIAARGHVVRRGYGLSAFKVDVAVAASDDPEHFRVGVLADGRSWGSRHLVLDRDALPVNVLQNLMNWPTVARVWLPSWRARRDEILDQIDALVAQVPVGSADTTLPTPVPAPLPSPTDPAASTDGTLSAEPGRAAPSIGLPQIDVAATASRPFVPWTPRTLGTADAIENLSPAVRAAVAEVIEAEGPIEQDELLKKVANAFGLQRVREQRLVALRSLVPKDQCVTTSYGTHVFPRPLISGGVVSDDFTWYRVPDTGRRELASVAMEELRNMCRDIARRSGGIAVQELARAALEELGYARASTATHHDAIARVEHLVARGWLTISDGHLTG